MKTVAMTNGCYDVLHRGHVEFLERCAEYGKLVVAINDDKSVRKLKGPTRPVNNENDRMYVVSRIEGVNCVMLVHSTCMAETIRAVRPKYWIKSGYTMDTLNPLEVAAAKEVKAKIILLPLLPGYSTTETIKKLQA